MADTVFRLRVTYGKTGRLRYLSHLEVARACERIVRRAGLEYAVTQGFNPRMKMAFGPALPVGTAGLAEAYDVWLRKFVPPAEALERLRRSAPEGIAPMNVGYVGEREASLGAAMVLAEYEVLVEDPGMGPGWLAGSLDEVMRSGRLEIEHKGKLKVYDLAVSVPEGIRVSEVDGRTTVALTVRMGEGGSLRPDALVREAMRLSGVSDTPISVTRTRLRPEQARA